MAAPIVTVAVVPHERFSAAPHVLQALFERTRMPFELIYVDGGAPEPVRRSVADEAQARGFRLIRTEGLLPPNVARNLALEHVRTPYVVFLDNDVLVSPGWLEALVDCAEETGAWAVGPLYCHGQPEGEVIHMAGGSLAIERAGGRRVYREEHHHLGRRVAEVREALRREPTESVELHCLLLRSEALRTIGPFDEAIWSVCNPDLCLALQRAGGSIFFEPASVVTYEPPPPLAWSDRTYFQLRWSRSWNRATLARYREKWQLADDDPGLGGIAWWLDEHRRAGLLPGFLAHGRRRALATRLLRTRPLAALEAWHNEWRFPASTTGSNPWEVEAGSEAIPGR